jgi:hypothetical protein
MNLFYCFLITLFSICPQENRNPKLMEEYAAARSAVSSIISDHCLTSEIDGSEYMVYKLGGGGMLFIIPYASEFKVYRYKDKVMSHTTLPKDSLPEIESLFNFAHSQESPLIYDAIESNAKYDPFYFYFGIFNGEGTPILELNSHSMKAFKQTISSRKQRKTYPLTQEQGYCLLSLFLSGNT